MTFIRYIYCYIYCIYIYINEVKSCAAHLSKSRRCPSRKGIGREKEKRAAVGSGAGSSSSQDLLEVGKHLPAAISYRIQSDAIGLDASYKSLDEIKGIHSEKLYARPSGSLEE